MSDFIDNIIEKEKESLRSNILRRFLSYASIGSQCDRHNPVVPSSKGQWELLKLLDAECNRLGLVSELDENGYLYVFLPASSGCEDVRTVAFFSHVDTAEDAPGEIVNPIVHDNYDGGPVRLKNGTILPEESPELLLYKGDTIVTSDGTSLLGADDKAGLAAIVSALDFLLSHPEIKHGPVLFVATPDEESGRGTSGLDYNRIKGCACYTMDAGLEGELETDCFNAVKAELIFKGVPVHPGTARGLLVNAVSMAALFVSMLPRSESPEATDEDYGFYLPLAINGSVSEARLELFLRDFDFSEIERRQDAVLAYAKAVEASFPGGSVQVAFTTQYRNMGEFSDRDRQVIDYAVIAVNKSCGKVLRKKIRGGTDGARIAEELKMPVPNIFTGAMLMHSVHEWVALSAMQKAVETIIRLTNIWTKSDNSGII
ncbi:peptidase T [Spirochaetia bacterium 38H-sp]|uniref:Peptidase T n=1 Tax=Rarispira pelagica TaxID=3141764 RepID=A0ABU9UA74_9SPIR